ncbi:MAG: TetR/AcrR family transcriptional regulator [SAR324 cluster bacterium]|jgi:AcrR family transcriptional regulator|nr:TetR/AcrR family transcriptional regulator [SAR324 cluster bacterium]
MNHPPKKQALLDSAMELFARDGFWQTTTASIAQGAGVATGTLFTYFPTKNDLVDEVYLMIKREALAEVQKEPKSQGSYEAAFKEIHIRLLKWGSANPKKFQLMLQLRQGNQVSQRIHETIEDDWKEGYEWIKLGQQEGKLASFPTNLLLSIIHGHLEAMIQHNIQHNLSEKEVDEVATISSEILWRYLSPQSKSPQ